MRPFTSHPKNRRDFFRRLFGGLAVAPAVLGSERTSLHPPLVEASSGPYLSEVKLFGGNQEPSGWKYCNGQLLLIAEYPALFSLLGTGFGGNGTTTFALPDLRGTFALGLDNNVYYVGETGGAATVTLTNNSIPSHGHVVNVRSGGGTSNDPSGLLFASNAEGIGHHSSPASGSFHSGMLATAGSGGAHNNMPPYRGLNFIISTAGSFPSNGIDEPTPMTDRYTAEIMLIGANFAPDGWIRCNGQLLAISEYEELFFVIGTTFGGDGETTFALPDLRNRLPIGADGSTYTLAQTGGTAEHTLSTAELPTHAHGLNVSSGAGTSTSPVGNFPSASLEGVRQYGAGADATLLSTAVQSTGGALPHENMPPFVCMTYCIALNGVSPAS